MGNSYFQVPIDEVVLVRQNDHVDKKDASLEASTEPDNESSVGFGRSPSFVLRN